MSVNRVIREPYAIKEGKSYDRNKKIWRKSYESQVWDKGRLARSDIWWSRSEAKSYAMGRKNAHYGRMTAAQARAIYSD